ncbi:ATP-binding protein [Photobacterium leiognathi]|uniref:ATP-binding protein n=1 Tax=Photobacterium leiognathi TaxID=553611 RepID=UPI00298285B4|nr:ATP-binding protein [Photobacterium leiognathi]
MKQIIYVISFISYLLCSPGCLAKENGVIRVGVPIGALQPFWGGDVDLPSGILHDMVSFFSDYSGLRVVYVEYPSILDAKKAVIDEEIDLALNYQNKNNEPKLKFSRLFQESVVGWTAYDKSNSLEEVKWGCILNTDFCNILKNNNINYNTYESNNLLQKAINSGDITGFIGAYNSIYYRSIIRKEYNHVYFDEKFGLINLNFIYSKNNNEIDYNIKLFKKFIKTNGKFKFERIKKRYHIEDDIYNEWYNDKNKIKIIYGFIGDNFPYSFYDYKNGEYKGIIHDIFDRISLVTPLDFEFVDISKLSESNRHIDVIPLVKNEKLPKDIVEYKSDFLFLTFPYKVKKTKEVGNIAIVDPFMFDEGSRSILLRYENIETLKNNLYKDNIKTVFINNNQINNDVMTLGSNDEVLNSWIIKAFNNISDSEIDGFFSKYSNLEYNIGYKKNTINLIFLLIVIITIIIIRFYNATVSRLKRKTNTVEKIIELSEAKKHWLENIINNIPNAVCITSNNVIVLTNKEFDIIAKQFMFKSPEGLLKKISSIISIDCYDLKLSIDNATRYFEIKNKIISSYDNIAFNMLVLTETTAQKEKELTLVKLHEESVKSLVLKKQFLAVISHELRTPISGIVGLIELLEKRNSNPIEMEMICNALVSTNKLKLLVDDILDFSKLDAEQLKINNEINNIVYDLCVLFDNFEKLAINKNLSLKIDWKASKYVTYKIDNLRLIQVLSNILSNAIKFTEMGYINISIRLEKDFLKFTITDTGIGMTESELKVLYDPFVQAQDNIARKYGGTGLGMAIVRDLLNLMNGNIYVTSLFGIGTKVEISIVAKSEKNNFILPTEIIKVNDSRLAAWMDVFGVNYLCEFPDKNKEKERNFYPSEVFDILCDKRDEYSNITDGSLSGHILIVEDDFLNQYLFKMQLSHLNLRCTIVNNGNEAIEFLNKKSDIDAIISDYHMPIMDGLKLTETIRRSESLYSNIPIVICTADNSEELKVNANELGVNSILLKPYSLSNLYQCMKDIFSNNTINDILVNGKLETWLTSFNDSEFENMHRVLIDSFSLSLIELNGDMESIKSVAHRLKGTAGALDLDDIYTLATQLDLNPCDNEVRLTLITKIEKLLVDAKNLPLLGNGHENNDN